MEVANVEEKKPKALTKKQQMALELLTSGEGLTYKQIGERIDVNPKTLWRWRNEPEFAHFQAELTRLNDIRWEATIDAARDAAMRLCKDGKSDFVKFVLQNAGYNPSQKVEADLHTDIIINIEE